MKKENNKINRRNFLKTAGAAGIGSVFATVSTEAAESTGKSEKPKFPQVPLRKFGKTGVKVPCLGLGTIFNLIENQIILKASLKWGINYWDTAHGYVGGNSEIGIGKFFEKNPEMRKKVFLVTKASGAKSIEDVENRLQISLRRMKTDYIDLFYGVHVLNNISQLKEELKPWAEKAKKRGVIKYFGFSTHKNMAENLVAASKLGWVDAILTTYNFRVMQDEKLQAAVEACHKAGIALTAMKTIGKKITSEGDKKLTDHFRQKGYTEGQAKIKAVLQNEMISCVIVRMENLARLTEDVAAALDKTKLAKADMEFLTQYANETCTGYCAGCGNICDEALPQMPYIAEIMRYLMYYNSYGDRDEARRLFAQIPHNVRAKLLNTDYQLAESRCPQHLPIAKLVAEAVTKLA